MTVILAQGTENGLVCFDRMPDEPVKGMTSNGCPVMRGRENPANGKNLLMTDHHLIDVLSQFNREKLPERTVHARGAGAYGEFEVCALFDGRTASPIANKSDDEWLIFPGLGYGGHFRYLQHRYVPGGWQEDSLRDTLFNDGHGTRISRDDAGFQGNGNQVLHRPGKLGLGVFELPVVLHPGSHQVPQHDARSATRSAD